MKFMPTVTMLSLVAVVAGCTSSSKVQEMIDASHQDYLSRLKAHEDSIAVLKQSAMAGLEKSSENAKRLDALEKQVAGLTQQMVVVMDLANAAKVISADTTVRVSDLEEKVSLDKEETDKMLARMTDIDKLYEEVLVRQYRAITESARVAIESLKEDGLSASTNAPVRLDEPIEIVAPDTAVPTNISEPASEPLE